MTLACPTDCAEPVARQLLEWWSRTGKHLSFDRRNYPAPAGAGLDPAPAGAGSDPDPDGAGLDPAPDGAGSDRAPDGRI